MAYTTFDQTRNHVFDVPLKDPASAVNRFGGNYPWTLEGDEQSIIHVRNSSETAARFIVQLDYDGGSYTLPLQELAPQQEKSFDIRLLRDAQVKDSIGRVIPSTVTSGQATWKAHGSPSLTGRLEVYNAAEATASSLSCSTTCCVSTVDTWCDPPSMSGLPGDTVTVKLLESLQQECDGRILGPFVVTDQAVWSSSNTAVISVGPVTTAGCQVSCLSAGTANAHADFDGISSILDITSGVCEGTFIPFPADCPFDVAQIDTETVATSPTDRTRKTIGIGEQVMLTLQPTTLGSVSWSVAGNGTLSATTSNPVTFTASDRASTPSVSATFGEGKVVSVTFTVVEPNSVLIEQETGTGVWHIQGTASCGFIGRPFIQPDNVSFENIEIREGKVAGIGTGYFATSNGQLHPESSWASVGSVTANKGSKVSVTDTISTGPHTATPYADGTFTWKIPWLFRIGTGLEKQFTTVTHLETTDATGKLTISKGGTSKSKNLNDPSSSF